MNQMSYQYSNQKNNEEKILDELNRSLKNIEKSNESLEHSKRSINGECFDSYASDFYKNLRKFQYSKKQMKKKIISASLVFSLFSSLSVAYFKSVFNIEPDAYKTQTYTYSTIDGYNVSNGIVKIDESEGDKTYIKVYEPWNFKTEREIKTYDITGVEYENIDDYLKLDLSSFPCKSEPEYLKDITSSRPLNDEEIKEVIKYLVYEDESVFSDGLDFSAFVFFYFLIILLTIFCELIFSMPFNIREITELYARIKEGKESLIYYGNKEETKEFIASTLEEIYNNDELRNKFVKLFNENKYLLNDPTILESKYKEVFEKVDTIKLREECGKYDEIVKKLSK